MAAKKQKYYVVWEGFQKGVFETWQACEIQIKGFEGAKFKSFESRAEAEKAAKGNPYTYINTGTKSSTATTGSSKIISRSNIIKDCICVDAACSGNPGLMEYRGTDLEGNELFRQGAFPDGTNNIGEFLALVHGLALLKKQNLPHTTIYSDSKTAISWVKKKRCNTKLETTHRNAPIFDLIERAETWLSQNTYQNPLVKWETESWGEIPADFGRK